MEFAFKRNDKVSISNPLNVRTGEILCGYSHGPACPNGKVTMSPMYTINIFAISNFGKSVPRKIHPDFPETHEIDEMYCASLETLLRLIMPSKREIFKKDGNLSKYGEKALAKATTFVYIRLESVKDKLIPVVEAKDFATRLYNLVNMFELSKVDRTNKDLEVAKEILSYFDGDNRNDKEIFVLRKGLPYYDITQAGMEAFKKFVLWILICIELGFHKLWDVDAFQHFVNDILMHD